jgi:transposase
LNLNCDYLGTCKSYKKFLFLATKFPDAIEDLKQLLLKVLSDLSSLQEEVKKFREENGALRADNIRLQAENAEVRRLLGRNSSNSHKPPSSDVYKKKAQSSVYPQSGGRTQGGQVGRRGKTLAQVCQADKEAIPAPAIPPPERRSCCGRKFGEQDAYELFPFRRQVFELPEPRLEAIEHKMSCIVCCGQARIGGFPSEASVPVHLFNRDGEPSVGCVCRAWCVVSFALSQNKSVIFSYFGVCFE